MDRETSYSNIVKVLEELVNIPLYTLSGICGDRIILFSNRGGESSVWSSELGGDLRRISGPNVVYVARSYPEDSFVVYSRDISGGKEIQKIFSAKPTGDEGEGEAFEMEPLRIMSLVQKNNVIVYTGVTARDIGVYLAKIGGSAEKIYSTDKMLLVTDYSGRHIVGFGWLHGNPRSTEIFILDTETGENIVYTPKEGSSNINPKIYEDKILFISDYSGDNELYLMHTFDHSPMKPSLRGRDYEKYEISDYLQSGWTYDGRIWFIVNSWGKGVAFIDGYEIPLPDGTPLNLEYHNNKLYVTFSSITTPTSVYLVDDNKPKLIVGEKPSQEIASMIREVKITSFESFDGTRIPCVIFESNTPKPGPTIVYIHGGPWSETRNTWSIMVAALLVSGYHVIAPNFRGSTGYGTKFRNLIIGDPGGGDLGDVVRSAQMARDIGLASELAIMGYSYGGFMTFLATVKYPDLWRCGVAGAGITDWEETYEISDAIFKNFIEILFNKDRETMRDRSAIHIADRLKAPICIIHPQNDTRTPLLPVLKYCQKLLSMGKTFELHIIPDVGHLVSTMDEAMKILYPAILFLKKHLQ